jgi:hypothetical protein|tara:strand:- start:2627 stop:3244 length:618 start_codon:yes stop_codon:yes gene_type:complete
MKNYTKNRDGIIYQIEKSVIDYNENYVNTRYVNYGELPTYMGYLRLGNIIGSIGRVPDSILDVGYGDGSFLKVCKNIIENCSGFDITNFSLPEGCQFVEDLSDFHDVITFFDSLEHFEDIEFVKDLKCNYVCISVPHCHNKSEDWFMNWKHRRPDEHLWHFDEDSLYNFMKRMGYTFISSSNIEDTIRKNKEGETNILTAVFKKK